MVPVTAALEATMASIAWDQTLVSLLLSIATGGVVYLLAARVLRRAAAARELRQQRDALEQVLAQLAGPAGEYLRDPTLDYPQRDMVELERRALQAQILFWRDLPLQEALRDSNDPERFAAAAERLRQAVAGLNRELEGRHAP
jgi:hypothetical protein